jgi:hypothetical protein
LLGEIRRKKTEAGVSLRAPVASVTVTASDDRVRLLSAARDDLCQAGTISDLRLIANGPEAAESIDIHLGA